MSFIIRCAITCASTNPQNRHLRAAIKWCLVFTPPQILKPLISSPSNLKKNTIDYPPQILDTPHSTLLQNKKIGRPISLPFAFLLSLNYIPNLIATFRIVFFLQIWSRPRICLWGSDGTPYMILVRVHLFNHLTIFVYLFVTSEGYIPRRKKAAPYFFTKFLLKLLIKVKTTIHLFRDTTIHNNNISLNS